MQTCKRQVNVEKIFISVAKHMLQTLNQTEKHTASVTDANVHVLRGTLRTGVLPACHFLVSETSDIIWSV